MFVDTHCHLNMITGKSPEAFLVSEHYSIISDVVKRAYEVGVEKIINVGTSLNESINSIEIAKRFESVYATIGVHPCDANDLSIDDLKDVIRRWQQLIKEKEINKIVAIGETGLDFFHKPFQKQMQLDFFKAQIEVALEHKLPLVVHVREAAEEVLTVLDEYRKHGMRGVIHCFLQQKDFADQVLEWGFYVGLDAPITYPKNEWLRDLFKHVSLERIILETDAPFLPPQQLRGKQNLPAYIPIIAQALADIKGCALADVESTTTANVKKLFGI